ncbi:MAG: DUF1329 domain-containing protein [Candidatus Binatia bacterium]
MIYRQWLTFAAMFVVITTHPSWADVAPGKTITKDNIAQAENLLTPATRWMVERGMPMQIIETKQVKWPKAYQDATEKFAAQVKLAADGREIFNYVAGLPFPLIDGNDPLDGFRVMWNVFQPPLDNLGLDSLTELMNSSGEVERTYEGSFRAMKWLGRLYLDPKPVAPHNPAIHYTTLHGPFSFPQELKGMSVLYFRYLPADVPDDGYVYVPERRRVARFSEANRSDALGGTEYDIDTFYGLNAKISNWTFRVLADKEILAVMHSGKYGDPSAWCAPRDGTRGIAAALPCVSWEKRRVWVIEGTPTGYPRSYAYSKRILYVDQEAFRLVVEELYDQDGELWKGFLPCVFYTKKPYAGYPTNPLDGATYNYEDEWFFVPNTVLVNIREGSATVTSAPPSNQKPAEWQPDWYFNENVSGNTQDIYSPNYLLQGGR